MSLSFGLNSKIQQIHQLNNKGALGWAGNAKLRIDMIKFLF
jgi:hypothetical protein